MRAGLSDNHAGGARQALGSPIIMQEMRGRRSDPRYILSDINIQAGEEEFNHVKTSRVKSILSPAGQLIIIKVG